MTVDNATVDAALADWAQRDRAAALRLFVTEARARSASARLSLGFALRESVWMGRDPAINEAKSAWWLEELALSGRSAARHPLTRWLAQEEARVDFIALARVLSDLRTTTPESGEGSILAGVRDLESALWFGPDAAGSDACTIRAHACLVDVVGRRSHGAVDSATPSRAITAHAAALRGAAVTDAWTAARRAQALCWIETVGSRAASGRVRRWREVWTVWRAVRDTRRRTKSGVTTGARVGT